MFLFSLMLTLSPFGLTSESRAAIVIKKSIGKWLKRYPTNVSKNKKIMLGLCLFILGL